jgi:hypothetical protein
MVPYLLILLIIIGYKANGCLASVDHKNTQLNSYLNQIRDNQEEKAGIIDIIKQQKSGAFLDIGSGRDTISYILNNLPIEELSNVNLIAADLEGQTLAEIAKRYPELYFNLDRRSNIDLSLLKMDATEMHHIKDSSIKAINASAVLHEINSYVPRKTPIDRFFGEAIRILEKDGFLIYRDPTLQSNPEEVNSLILKNDFAKKFFTVFLPKFLDKHFTQITDMYGNSIKPEFYYHDRTTITLSLIGKTEPVSLDYQSFVDLQTNSIDFTKDITIKAPRRLLSEIQRHYILFVKNVYPIAFIEDKAINDARSLESITPERAKKTIEDFSKTLGIGYNKKLTQAEIKILTAERSKLNALLNNGLTLSNLKTEELQSLKKLFESKGISTNLYKVIANDLWLDAKLFTMIYNRLQNKVENNNLPLESVKWLVREGEEYYFYFTTEELINYLVKFCNFYLKGTNKEGYILAPISKEHIKYAPREVYTDLLNKDMLQIDANKKKQEFVTTKTIIKFQLMLPKFAKNKSRVLLNMGGKYSSISHK